MYTNVLLIVLMIKNLGYSPNSNKAGQGLFSVFWHGSPIIFFKKLTGMKRVTCQILRDS